MEDVSVFVHLKKLILTHLNSLNRCVVLSILLINSSLVSYGQDTTQSVPRHAVKFSPLHLLNPEVRSIQLAYEYRWLSNFSVQLEGGYVFGDIWWSYPSAKTKGYKLKEELRWYLINHERIKKRDRNVFNGTYLAVEFHQNRLVFTRVDDERYIQNGVGIKGGFAHYSSWGFVLDINAGLTRATTNMGSLGIPLNNVQPGRNGYTAVLPIIGLRVGYWIK